MDEFHQCMVAKYCEVKEMGLAEYHELRGFPAPEKDQKGLLVLLDGPKNHPDYDGYITWWPANVFEKSLYVIPENKDRVYAEIILRNYCIDLLNG